MPTTTTEKAREMRLRRMADRRRLRLEKSRSRDPRAYDFGTYHLVDPRVNTIVAGNTSDGYGLSLDDVERALTEADDARRPVRGHAGLRSA